jgi:transcription elongation factor S-II
MSKHGDAKIAATAAAICDAWKSLISKRPADPAVAASSAPAPPPVKSEEHKAEVKAEPKAEVKAEPKTEIKNEAASSSSSSSRPKVFVSKTGDQTRDSVRERLQEAFDKGVTENAKYLHEIETDTHVMAAEAEVAMYDKFGGTSKEYKARFRSLMFNLRDPKNPEFVRQVEDRQPPQSSRLSPGPGTDRLNPAACHLPRLRATVHLAPAHDESADQPSSPSDPGSLPQPPHT